MFETLSTKLTSIFSSLRGQRSLSEENVSAALREIRLALLEADVSLEVVRSFVEKVKERAVGAEVVKSVTPAQMVVKIVHDELVSLLGNEQSTLDFSGNKPVFFLMAGLQGSGKTTTTAKLAKRLKEKTKKRILLASLDVYRPAAQDQLRVLGEQIGVDTLPIIPSQKISTL